MAVYACLCLAGVLLYAVGQLTSGVAVVGVTSTAAVLLAVRHYQPRRRNSWLALAASLFLTMLGRIVYDALPGQYGQKPLTWIVWLIHLTTLVLFTAGMVGLARHTRERTVTLVLDTAIVVLGAGLLFGILIGVPYAIAPAGGIWAAARIGYVARDVVVIAATIHLVTSARWSVSSALLATGPVGLVVYDVLYRLGRVRGDFLQQSPILLGFLGFFVAIGAAALVPSMRSFDEPDGEQDLDRDPRLRLGLVALLALLPSALLLSSAVDMAPWVRPLVTAVSTVILGLALFRLVDVSYQLRRRVARERIAGRATADLADARDSGGVTAATERAAGDLLAGPVQVTVGGDVPDVQPAAGVVLVGGPTDDGRPAVSISGDPQRINRVRAPLASLAQQASDALERIRLNQSVIKYASESYFRTLVQNATDVIMIVDQSTVIRYASPSSLAIFGAHVAPSLRVTDLLGPKDEADALALCDRAATAAPGEEVRAQHDWTVRAPDGQVSHLSATCRDLREEPSIGAFVLTLRNVTAQRTLERELTRQAYVDPLTGLSRREYFSERLESLGRHVREDGKLGAVFFIDLDDLKLVNDSYGHNVGDEVLRVVGHRLQGFTSGMPDGVESMAARIGGDEFAVLLGGASTEAELAGTADRLVQLLGQPVQVGGQEILCAASLGLATTDDASDGVELLRDADIALYAAKNAGKGQWRRFRRSMHDSLAARMELRTALDRAIRHDELRLAYQPIVGLSDRSVVGYEALVRWRHPRRGALRPAQFIGVAEESGLVLRMGEWVLDNALRFASGWRGNGRRPDPYLAVNVSGRQLVNTGFVDMLRGKLADHGMPAERVVMEITESTLLREGNAVWNDLSRLRRAGIRVAVDDFGTGYSALSHLTDIPLDIVKLDRSFVSSLVTSAKQRQLVRGIVDIADGLDLTVVAEGIETEPESAAVTEAGCRFGQGYLFGRPMPPDAVAADMSPNSRR
ncbi:putative bifunctional diguanylate cyclase/phosphodiesterase [Asanoa iriomotensis]|nr:GGDEF domain-containing phosphodiesterase [Asanoa iriomotensis]